jgi:hypothetical protein
MPGTTGKLVSGPEKYDSCDFVDNAVMKNYADEIVGADKVTRCMEHLDLEADYKDPVKVQPLSPFPPSFFGNPPDAWMHGAFRSSSRL